MKSPKEQIKPYVNEEERWIFVHIPKTGGMTINRLLGIKGGHANLQMMVDCGVRVKQYFRFAFVRNPYLRALSFYNRTLAQVRPKPVPWMERVKAYRDFDHFVEDMIINEGMDDVHQPWIQHLYTQRSWLLMNGEISMDFIGRHETYEDDVRRLLKRLGKPVPDEIPHANRTPGRYELKMSTRSAEALTEKYMHDFYRFDYKMDPAAVGIEVTD